MDNAKLSVERWEKEVYSKGEQLNKWPFSEVVSDVLRLTSGSNRQQMKILEVGCGCCNNLWFVADAGFQVHGIDSSPTAIQYGDERLNGLGFENVVLEVGDARDLPWPSNYFDIVLDRAVVGFSTYQSMRQIILEANRVLRPGGLMLVYGVCGSGHSRKLYGEEVEPNTYTNFSANVYDSDSFVTFLSLSDLREAFSVFGDIRVKRKTAEELESAFVTETYSLICFKRE